MKMNGSKLMLSTLLLCLLVITTSHAHDDDDEDFADATDGGVHEDLDEHIGGMEDVKPSEKVHTLLW
jgi:hypothetical protein